MNYEQMLQSLPPAARRKALALAAKDQKAIDAANIVKTMRQTAGVSQQQLADLMKIKQPAIAKMERQNDMKLSTLAQIVRQFNGTGVIRVKLPNKSRAVEIPFG